MVKDIKRSYKNSLNWLNCSSKQNKYRPYIIGFITTFLACFHRLSVLFHIILALVTKEVSHVSVSYGDLVKCSLRCDSFWVPVRLFAPKSVQHRLPFFRLQASRVELDWSESFSCLEWPLSLSHSVFCMFVCVSFMQTSCLHVEEWQFPMIFNLKVTYLCGLRLGK